MDLWKVCLVEDQQHPGFELFFSDGVRAAAAFEKIEGNAGAKEPVLVTDDYSTTLSIRRDDWRMHFMQCTGTALEASNLIQLQQLRAQRKGQRRAQQEAGEDERAAGIIPVPANAIPSAILTGKANGGA